MGERVYSWNGDWKFKTDRAMDFKNMIHSRGCTISNLAKICGLTSGAMSSKLRNTRGYGAFFTEKQVQDMAEQIPFNSEEIHDFFISVHKEQFTKKEEMQEKGEAKHPITGCFKSGNGFEFRYINNGKLHSTYGATEIEARKKANLLEKSSSEQLNEVKKMEKKDNAVLNISREEALALIDQLFHDVWNKQVKPECQSTIQSIYWRLTTQFME